MTSSPAEPVGTAPQTATASRRARLPRWLKIALSAGVGVLVSALLAEGFVLVVFGEQVKFPRHVVEAPWGLRYNDPGSSYRHKSADVDIRFRINGQGLRADREYAYAKPTGVKRIVCLGDSFTVGYEVEAEDTFAAVLERQLNGAGGPRVEVLNAGVSGFSNAEECLYLERELLKYEPDVVVLSFFPNDLDDNVRSDLFGLEGGRAVPRAERYVPAGRLANLLNTSWFFNLLSERSNAFCLVKERLTSATKRELVASNEAERLAASDESAGDGDYRARLAAAILERLYETTSSRGIALVIQSIPERSPETEGGMRDDFPQLGFAVDRPGLAFVAARGVLAPHADRELLYWTRSHSHWTPFSHRLSGEELARVIAEHGWVR